MVTIRILTHILIGTFVSVTIEGTSNRLAQCIYSKDSKGLLTADCTNSNLRVIPENVQTDVETLDLRQNYIGKLANDTFVIYPNIKKLYLSLNQVHTVERGSLETLNDLEVLDLADNALKEVPSGLPKSLTKLYLSGNPVVDMSGLVQATGLHTLHLRNCDLTGYPRTGLLPNLIELDVSDNAGMTDAEPVQLARTCRLARLNVTDAGLFRAGRAADHCRCLRFVQWASEYKIKVTGLGGCPEPPTVDVDDDDNPMSDNCTRMPDDALAVYKECMAEWEHRNMPYWAVCSGLAVVAAVALGLCLCWRRRRRRAADKAHGGQAADAKGCNDGAAVNDKTADPSALLSSS